MARFRKIDPRTWRDEKFRPLDPLDKLIVFYILTGQANRIGIFNFSPAMAAEEIGIDPQTFSERFENVCRTLNWEWDEGSRVVYIPTYWKYNIPENPNVVIGLLKDVGDIPETKLLSRFSTNFAYLPENLHETFAQTLAERYPKPSPNQENENEQENEQDTQKGAGAPKARVLYDSFREINKILPHPDELTEERLRKCQARKRQAGRSGGFSKFVSDYSRAVLLAQDTPFLTGEGKNGWRADFDWFIQNHTNVYKVLEGKYADGLAAGHSRTSSHNTKVGQDWLSRTEGK